MRALVFLLVLTTLVLSGCASPGRPAANTPAMPSVVKQDAFANADPSESGEIVGRTLDDEFLPLPDVTVAVQGTSATATTTQDGVFYFTKVPARGYALQFSKPGYATKNQSVLVSSGQRVNMQILLPRVADVRPYMDDGFTFRGHINCSVRGNASGTNTNPECGAYSADKDLTRNAFLGLLPGVRWLLVELAWQPSVPGTNDKLTLALRPYQGESWRQVQGSHPLKVLVGPDDFQSILKMSEKDYPKLGGQLQLFVFPGESVNQNGVGVGTAIEQDFTLYATSWYRMDPPPGYSRLPPS